MEQMEKMVFQAHQENKGLSDPTDQLDPLEIPDPL